MPRTRLLTRLPTEKPSRTPALLDVHAGPAALLSADVRQGRAIIEHLLAAHPVIGRKLRQDATLWVGHLTPAAHDTHSLRVVAVADQDPVSGKYRLYALVPGHIGLSSLSRTPEDDLIAAPLGLVGTLTGTGGQNVFPESHALLGTEFLDAAGFRTRLNVPARQWWPPEHHVQLQGRWPQIRTGVLGSVLLAAGLAGGAEIIHQGLLGLPVVDAPVLFSLFFGMMNLGRLRPTDRQAEARWQRTLTSMLGRKDPEGPEPQVLEASAAVPVSVPGSEAVPKLIPEPVPVPVPARPSQHVPLTRALQLGRMLARVDCTPESRAVGERLLTARTRLLQLQGDLNSGAGGGPLDAEVAHLFQAALDAADLRWQQEQRLQEEALKEALRPVAPRDF